VEAEEKIRQLEEYKVKLVQWQKNHDADTRSWSDSGDTILFIQFFRFPFAPCMAPSTSNTRSRVFFG
jgi:hypothetical protein